MQNAGHHNARELAPEENDVLADLPAVKTGADMIAGAARNAIVGEIPAALLQLVDVAYGLSFAPSMQRIDADAQQIRFGTAG